jgi:hypothetical protein
MFRCRLASFSDAVSTNASTRLHDVIVTRDTMVMRGAGIASTSSGLSSEIVFRRRTQNFFSPTPDP